MDHVVQVAMLAVSVPLYYPSLKRHSRSAHGLLMLFRSTSINPLNAFGGFAAVNLLVHLVWSKTG